jgi:hypothetical protein
LKRVAAAASQRHGETVLPVFIDRGTLLRQSTLWWPMAVVSAPIHIRNHYREGVQ